jgi:hypothetical protein
MGSYCKAYSVQKLREFEGWTDSAHVAEKRSETIDGIADGAYLYLHSNFIVTEGIFMDEGIVFSALTSDWIEFCKIKLAFEVPVYR